MQLLTRVFPPIPHIHAISVACPYLVEHAVTSRLSALPPGSQPRLQSVSGTNWTRQQATRRSCPGSEFRNALSSRAQKRAVTAGPFILFVFSSFFSSASECPLRNYVAPNEIVLGTEPAAARCGRAMDTVDHHGLNMRETGLTFSFFVRVLLFPSPLFFFCVTVVCYTIGVVALIIRLRSSPSQASLDLGRLFFMPARKETVLGRFSQLSCNCPKRYETGALSNSRDFFPSLRGFRNMTCVPNLICIPRDAHYGLDAILEPICIT